MFANTGPRSELELERALVEDRDAGDVGREQVGRELDAGTNEQRATRERASSEVLPVPGTSSRSRCPSASRQITTRRKVSSGACTTRPRFATIAATRSAGAGSDGELSQAGAPPRRGWRRRSRPSAPSRPPLAARRRRASPRCRSRRSRCRRETSLKTNRSAFFAPSFSRARARPCSAVVGGEADEQLARRAARAERRERRRSSARARASRRLASFGRFAGERLRGPVVGDGGGHDHHVGVCRAGERLALEVGRGRRRDDLDARRARERRGSRRAARRRRRGGAPRLRARRPSVPTSGCRRSGRRRAARASRRPRRARACRAAGCAAASSTRAARTISSGSAIRPTPSSPSAVSPSSGPTSTTPRARSVSAFARVAAMRPHAWVHRGRDERGTAVGERRLGEDVVGEAVRELRERVRRARRDEEQVGAGQMEVDVLAGRPARERAERLGA